MINIILVTYHLKNYPLYIPTEEVIITQLIKANSALFSLQIIQTDPDAKSSLFKQFPIIYINNKIIDNHSFLFFIKDLLYPKREAIDEDDDDTHFSYLISFLKRDYHQIYMKDYKSLKSSSKLVGFPLERMKAFREYYMNRREKDYVALIMKCFIEEYQAVYPSEVIEMSISKEDYTNDFMIINTTNNNDSNSNEILFNERLLKVLNQYAMNLTSTKDNNGILPQEMEVTKGWSNTIFSIGLFVGISLLFYLLSLRKK